LYFLLAILTSIFLFSTATICNQCGVQPEEKLDIEEEEAEEEAVTEEEEETGEEGEEVEGIPEAEEEEEEAEEEAEEDEEVAPTIELKIYQGPTYSEADGVCYYRIKATVTGNPAPTIEFSKDDSSGAFGSKKAQVNLHDPGDTYTLTATATNSEGTATDSIDISWGCDESDGKGGNGDEEETVDLKKPDWWVGRDFSTTETIYYDFTEQAPSALWKADIHRYGEPPPGLGLLEFGDTYTRYGAAFYRYHGNLEDGTGQPRILETHPYQFADGFICGIYQDILVPPNSYFEAEIGFIEGMDPYGTDEDITFSLYFDVPEGGRPYSYYCEWEKLCSFNKEYNGHLGTIVYSLEHLVGETGNFIFLVEGGRDIYDFHAVWVNPVIVIRE